MYTTLFSAALFTAAALQGVRAQETYHSDFAVNQPELVVGKSAKISWQPTEGPYNILIVPESDPCNEILADLGDHTSTLFNWDNVNIPAGKRVLISIQDKNGNEGWSQAIDVKPAEEAAASSAVSSSAVASASQASASVVSGTTLVVTPTAGTGTSRGSAPASSSPAASIVAVGAAGDGIINTGKGANDANGALSTVAVSVPALALAALGAVLVL